MKKISLALALFTLTIAAQAQQRNSPKHKMEQPDKGKMADELGLTEDQKARMKMEQQRFRQEMKALEGKDNITVAEQRQQREALSKTHRENMQNILTAEQRAKVEDLRKNSMHKKDGMKHDGKHHDKMHDKGMNHMDHLNLNAEQKAKLEESRKSMQTDMKALKDNSSLTQEARRAEMKAIAQRHQQTMRSVLTPDQYKQWEEMKQDKMEKKGDMPRRQGTKISR